jgi:hypothetical protein
LFFASFFLKKMLRELSEARRAQRLSDLSQTYPEALVQSPAAAGPAYRDISRVTIEPASNFCCGRWRRMAYSRLCASTARRMAAACAAACLAACVTGTDARAGDEASPPAQRLHLEWNVFADVVLVLLTIVTVLVYMRRISDDESESRGAYSGYLRKQREWQQTRGAGGLSVKGAGVEPAEHALYLFNEDADIAGEARALAQEAAHMQQAGPHLRARRGASSLTFNDPRDGDAESMSPSIPISISPGGVHCPNAATSRLLAQAGGPEAIRTFTDLFYEKSFNDGHLQQFIRDFTDPHGERLADWICEKMGFETPWTSARARRKVCPFMSHGMQFKTPTDRASAHRAAWHSPKRKQEDLGKHFQLHDCRVWMRLNFWALRQSGIWGRSPSFVAYYVKFIAHFVSIYEHSAPQFARESARWSASPANIERYRANGNMMEASLFRMQVKEAINELPAEERDNATSWPYTF